MLCSDLGVRSTSGVRTLRSSLFPHLSQHLRGPGMPWLILQEGLEHRPRLGLFAFPQQGARQVQVRGRKLRREITGAAEVRYGLLVLPKALEDETQVIVRGS